jgi:hypothetical protein
MVYNQLMFEVNESVRLIPEHSGGISRVKLGEDYIVEEVRGDMVKLRGVDKPLFSRRLTRTPKIGDEVIICVKAEIVNKGVGHGLCYEVMLPQQDFNNPRTIWLNANEVEKC